MKNWLRRLKEKLCNGPPGPPGSIEYIRWRASKEVEAYEDDKAQARKEAEG